MEMPDKFVELAQVICERCFCGCLPDDANVIAEGVVRALPCMREASEEAAQAFVNRLVSALEAHLALHRANWMA
jgi:hypothetical protein